MDARIVTVLEVEEADVAATGAALHVRISGSKLFSGAAALKEAVEVRRLHDALAAEGVGEGEFALENVHLDVSKGLLSKSSRDVDTEEALSRRIEGLKRRGDGGSRGSRSPR